jgi:hypothetical protein
MEAALSLPAVWLSCGGERVFGPRLANQKHFPSITARARATSASMCRMAWVRLAAPALLAAAAAVDARGVAVRTEAELLGALLAHTTGSPTTLTLTGDIALTRGPLLLGPEHAGVRLVGPARLSGHPVLLSGAEDVTLSSLVLAGGPLTLSNSSSVTLSSLTLTHGGLSVLGCDSVAVTNSTLRGGVRLLFSHRVDLGHSTISNEGNGTCVQVAACGNATTLEPCNVTVHDNYIHDCRTGSGGSPYAPAAQGVLLGGAEGSGQVTVGVLVRNNEVRGVDEMGIRINNDNYGPSILNNVTLNRIVDWGQLPGGAAGGDNTDSGCLYVYGHWFGPGNALTYNDCLSTNASWGQNGLYLDDASTGQIAFGNYFRNATRGSPVKLNGGAFNVIHSNVVVGGINLGFGNCRGIRGPPSSWYTCPQQPKWLEVLEGAGYRSEPWASVFPFYAGWCTNTTQGPDDTPCAPPGAPAGYACEALSRGNTISRLAGVWMAGGSRNGFTMQSVPPGTFPNASTPGACPSYVVSGEFDAIDGATTARFYGTSQFVDATPEGGDYTLAEGSQILLDMPDFVRAPYARIGPGNGGR